MQTTSAAYKTKIKEPSREFNCKITIGTKIFTNDDIVDIILDSPQPSEGFCIGNTPSQTLDLTLLNKGDTIYSANQVKIEIGINTGSTIEYLVLGYFNIDDIEKTDYTTKITAFDNMIKFEKPFFSSISYPATLQAVVNELAAKTGVQFTGSLPSYTLSKLEGFTCREILGYVASLCGGNAVITRDGKFTIVVPQDINYHIGTDNYFDYKREEVKYKISKVSCKAGDTELIKGTLGADSMELTFENPWVTDSILTDIYTKLNGFEYLGYTMKWQGDLSLDIGDIVSCTDIKGVVRKLPILSQKLTYNGGLTSEIGAKGETKNKNSYNSKGENTKKLERVVTELAIVNKALIDVAYIGDLTAGNIKFDTASGGTLDLQSLLANFISGDNGQFIHLTGSNVVIDNAVIKDAMIDTISAGKISAGTMSTNKFTISSDSGNLVIADNTIQIKDGTRVRVQIGKDASNDYSLYVWDSTGKLMFDALGLKADAIKDKIIRNDMVSDSANISGSKLDIDSVIVEVNTNGTETFKSSKVKMDLTGQTLDVAFTKVSQDAAGAVETANLAQSALTIANDKIETLVKNTTIVKENGTTVQLKDAYTETAQTVSGLSTKVTSIDTTVNGENGLTSKMQIVEQKVTATGITTTISEAINAGTNSITTTQFVMDKTGFTIKNGALTIRNKANSIVLCGDSEGNLQIGGNNADGSLVVRDASNNKIININKYGAEFANGAIKMTETYVIGGTAGGGMVQYGTKQTYNHSGTESVGADGYRYWDTTETNFGWQGADIQTYKINTSGTRFSDEYRTTITDRWFEMHYKEYVGDSLDALKSRYVIFDMANGNGAISGDLSIKKGQKVMSRGLKLQGIPLEANNFRNGCTFDYDTTGNGQVGPLLSFGGLGDAYECQIASHYQYGHKLKTRSLNGDTGSWGPWYEIYNTGYKPFQRYVTPNGFCLRFDDGTQICWYREQISLACIHVHNNIYYNTTSFTFPYPFAETPAVHGIWATSSITWAHPTSGCTASTAEVRIFSSHSGSVSGILGYLAIGKFA